MDEALDYIAGSPWFSSLDFCNGYWKVELVLKARVKMAFSIGQGLRQFLSHLMEKVLGGNSTFMVRGLVGCPARARGGL